MYGTIVRRRLKPGKEDEFRRMATERLGRVPGLRRISVYRMESDPQEVWAVVAHESREAYRANAETPEQKEFFDRLSTLMEGEPEWHDGEVIVHFDNGH